MSAKRFVAGVKLASGAMLLCLVLSPVPSQAQAWLPGKGSYSFGLDFSDSLNKKHYTPTGAERDVGHTDLEIFSLSGSYAPSDRWLINASLPYVSGRHRGPNGGGHDTEIDNGSWHGTVTDLQLTVHYQLLDGPVAVSPYVGIVMPTHNYVSFGHAAPGRRLDEYWVGFYAATSLNEWIPRTYAQLRGNYAFVEKVQDISHDRTNATLEIGHFLTDRWSVRMLVSKQWTHGGIDVPVPLDSPLFPDHDRLAAEEFLNLGAGVGWAVNERLSVYALYMESNEGTNAHKVDHRTTVGMSYGVGAH
jgi:hypothetical protein